MAKKTTTVDKDAIFQISVNTKLGEFEGNLGDDLKIDVNDLTASYMDQPGKYAWWAILAAQARAKSDRIKSEIDNLKDYMGKTLIGELDAEIRAQLEYEGEKVTETKVERLIYQNEKYIERSEQLQQLRLSYAEANGEATILESARDSLDQRKDMLISLGAQLRSEGSNTELGVRKEQAKQILKNKKMAD